jgi:hypothetical protein
MPDTRENQAAYPQVYNQKPGLGFPIARIGAVISLACGAVVNLGFCQYAGKGQGEVSLLRRLWDVLRPGDVLLGDRLLANWATIVLLGERGVELVGRLNTAQRRADFRRGRRLGPRRPPRALGQADVDPVAGPGRIPRIARVHHRPGDADSGPAAGVPDPGDRGGDDAAGPAAGDQGGPGDAVPGSLA